MSGQPISGQPHAAENDAHEQSEQSTEELAELFTELVGQFDEVIQLLEPMRARAEQQEAAPLILMLPEDEDSESEEGIGIPGMALIIPGGAYLTEGADGQIDQEKLGSLLKGIGKKLKKINWGKVAGGVVKGALGGIAGGPAGMLAGAAKGGLGTLAKSALKAATSPSSKPTRRPSRAPAPHGAPQVFVPQSTPHGTPAGSPVAGSPVAGAPVAGAPVAASSVATSNVTQNVSCGSTPGAGALSADALARLAQQLAPLLAGYLGQGREGEQDEHAGEYSDETREAQAVAGDLLGYEGEADSEDDESFGVLEFLSEINEARGALVDALDVSDLPGWRGR